MEVSEQVLLKYKNGPLTGIPAQFVFVDENGRRWLKLRPSCALFAKLLLGDECKKMRNPSLSAALE